MKEFEKTCVFIGKCKEYFLRKKSYYSIVKIKSLFRSSRAEGKRFFRAIGGI